MNKETREALLGLAGLLVDERMAQPNASLFKHISDWQEMAAQAETHGLSVMLGRLSAQGLVEVPRVFDLQLKALTIRHQKILAARDLAIGDVIDIFNQHRIRFAFLKGAALARLIYDPPWLRPMRDIDILVAPDQALQAQRLLREVGFSNRDQADGYLFEHHHLPNSSRRQNGFNISLEIHHNALSGDVDDSITLPTLMDDLQTFELAGETVHALGHRDMLRHLCHHTFEPAETIKLGSIVDIIRYANRYIDEIDWEALHKSLPRVGNTLSCIHALIPLPAGLQEKLVGKIPDDWQPGGVGSGFMPLSKIARLPEKRQKIEQLLTPSEWWMHVFYNVPPEKSLRFTRTVRHPLNIAKWLLRRYQAANNSKKTA